MSNVILQVHYADTGVTTEEEFKSIPHVDEVITKVSDGVSIKYRVLTRNGTGHGEGASDPVSITVSRID